MDENETEWLMEEIQVTTPRPTKDGPENGHVTAKSVTAEALSSLRSEDPDSEDEVLAIPEVKVHAVPSVRGPAAGAEAGPPPRMGLVPTEKVRRARPRTAHPAAAFHDDSDEDLLHI